MDLMASQFARVLSSLRIPLHPQPVLKRYSAPLPVTARCLLPPDQSQNSRTPDFRARMVRAGARASKRLFIYLIAAHATQYAH